MASIDDVEGTIYNGDMSDITLGLNQFILIKCDTGRERKFWHHYAEQAGWQHVSVRTKKFSDNIIIVCKLCNHSHYISEMPLNCCEYDSQIKYCDECDGNIIDVTDPDDYIGPDATFKLSKYSFNAVAMGPTLPDIPKRQQRKRNRLGDKGTENMKRSEDGHRYIITTSI